VVERKRWPWCLTILWSSRALSGVRNSGITCSSVALLAWIVSRVTRSWAFSASILRTRSSRSETYWACRARWFRPLTRARVGAVVIFLRPLVIVGSWQVIACRDGIWSEGQSVIVLLFRTSSEVSGPLVFTGSWMVPLIGHHMSRLNVDAGVYNRSFASASFNKFHSATCHVAFSLSPSWMFPCPKHLSHCCHRFCKSHSFVPYYRPSPHNSGRGFLWWVLFW